MQKYQNVIQDKNGNVIVGASVLVQSYPGALTSTIYKDNGVTTTANPLTTDSNGNFSFFAIDGLYQFVVSGAAINTFTLTAVQIGTGLTVIASAIPFIFPGSGSMANNGAVTLTTPLNIAYANAFMWFTAGQIFSGSLAGWYFAQMSSTTLGTVFSNTYTPGIPAIPALPTTFVSVGPGAFTGDVTEGFGPQITIAANSLVANSTLVIVAIWAMSITGQKVLQVRYSGTGGTALNGNNTASSASSAVSRATIFNREVSQQAALMFTQTTNGGASLAQVSSGMVYPTVNATLSSSLVIGATRASAADNVVLEGFQIEVTRQG